MAGKNIECQLAQAQMGRYVRGDNFSAEALNHLESHLFECPVCMEVLSARKRALQALLSTEPEFTKESESPESARTRVLRQAMLNKIRAEHEQSVNQQEPIPAPVQAAVAEQAAVATPEQANTKPAINTKSFTKPFALTGVLIVLLVAMNTVLKDPTQILGPRASEKVAASNAEPNAAAPEIETSDTSAIPVVSSFDLVEVVPPLFRTFVEDFSGELSDQELTRKNTLALIYSDPDSLEGVSAPTFDQEADTPPPAPVKPVASPSKTVKKTAPRKKPAPKKTSKPRNVAKPTSSDGVTVYLPE